MDNDDQHEMKEKIGELEKQIAQLRTSRRILMNLFETSTREKTQQIVRLEKEIHMLRRRNQQIAQQLLFMKVNARIPVSAYEVIDPL